MTVAIRKPLGLVGHDNPRIAPPLPAVSDIATYAEVAAEVGLDPMPWQLIAARYLEATAPDGRHLYPEVAIIVARQNGKSSLLIPLIVKRLRDGRRVMHTAQDRALPREIYGVVAELMWENYPELFPTRNGRATRPRYANGSEEVRLTNGGVYSIVAPSPSGARGPSRDTVIIDEVREMESGDFIAAAKPTLTASPDPQIIYLSNAGKDESVVLNDIIKRADQDEALAYLEWSAAPHRSEADEEGWAEANPGMGNERPGMGSIEETLRRELRTHTLENKLDRFNTEHLCRSVITEQPRIVGEAAWEHCRGGFAGVPSESALAFAMDPSGHRASVVRAWLQSDGRIAIEEVIEARGETAPIDVERLGRDIVTASTKPRASDIAYASWTDKDIARYVPRAKALDDKEFAAASEAFARYVHEGRIVWDDAPHITADLKAAVRRSHSSGAWSAVPASPERSITAVLAAIRAVWKATTPRNVPRIG